MTEKLEQHEVAWLAVGHVGGPGGGDEGRLACRKGSISTIVSSKHVYIQYYLISLQHA